MFDIFDNFPKTHDTLMDWSWDTWQPYYVALAEADLTEANLNTWLAHWSELQFIHQEVRTRLRIATDIDGSDTDAKTKYRDFNHNIQPHVEAITDQLNKKLLHSGLSNAEIAVPLRNLQAAVDIFHPDNLPLNVEISNLRSKYSEVSGSVRVIWDGEEKTVQQMNKYLYDPDRSLREQTWRLTQDATLEKRADYDALWQQYMGLRQQVVANVGLESYRDYAWKDRNRHDYTPDDVLRFCDAIEQVVVPANARLKEQVRQKLAVESLRPWDINVDPELTQPIQPYETIDAWQATMQNVFEQLDPQLGHYFGIMRESKLLDLDNRPHKHPGGYNTHLPVTGKPFILMNAVGVSGDIRTFLHETGHAFHAFERQELPYALQRRSPMEFNEVASMAMEFLALPYLHEERGGFFNTDELKRYMYKQLTTVFDLWCHMATVVLFQHWIYANHEEASDAARCDKKWVELRQRFLPYLDWTALEKYRPLRWRRQLHIFLYPFYYVEYGLARLGAVQVWMNAERDPDQALQAYREALRLGGTATLPDLFEAAGAQLDFSMENMECLVQHVEAKFQI